MRLPKPFFAAAATLAAVLILAPHARADATASAQATVATPQAALIPQAAPACAGAALAAPGDYSCGAAAALAPQAQIYVPQAQLRVVQRQFVPQQVYVQRQAVLLAPQAYAPVAQQAVVTPYVPQAQALAQVNSYGGGVAAAPVGRRSR
jgi:hypothetical protein